jgi:GTP-binding protein
MRYFMFVDKATIKIKAGNGGDGAVSFHREKYVASGGPDGGNGGKGGDVIFVADSNVSSLIDFKYNKKYVAKNGENGGSKCSTGKSAEDLIVKVPKGTIVRDSETGRILADISNDEPKIIAKGGKGGKGNMNFASSTRQIPRFAKPGFLGEEFDVTLELKLLADVGLVGFPNVGKSTFISVVSGAKPKIANYHFTTLTPVLGVVKVDAERSFVMADIPGLIEGASDGIGLGHQFLRHVDRCRLIVHIIDVSEIEGRDSCEDFETINKELEKFDSDLAKRPMIVAANKADIASEEQIEKLRNYIESKDIPFFVFSAATKQGVKPLVDKISEMLDKLPPIKEYEAEPITIEEQIKKNSKEKFTIEVIDGVYYVESRMFEPIFRSIDIEDYSSLQYFQKVLRSSGIIDKLESMGIKEGDTVNILGFEFDYIR